MADDPKLIVALEARLDKFEKQMRQAGLIAEREMKAIEARTSQITIGTAAGNLLAKGIEAGIKAAIDAIQQAIDLMGQLGSVASKTALSFEEIQRIGHAAALGGISQSDMLKGLDAVGAKMDEMNRRETELSKLLDENNVKYKDRNGLVVDANKGLDLAANLMAKAGSAFEKIEIARIFGLTADWVKVLGEGADKLREVKGAAQNINPDLERQVQHLRVLMTLATQISAEFQSWGTMLSTYVIGPLASATAYAASLAESLAAVGKGGIAEGAFDELAKRMGRINELVQNARKEAEGPLRITVRPSKSGVKWPGTDESGGDKDAFTRAQERLQQTNELRKAELALVGESVAKQEEARQIVLLTEAAKRSGLNVDTAITEQLRQQAAQAGAIQQQLVERTARWNEMLSMSKELGSTLSSAMQDLVLNGKKFDEVLKNIANRLASKAFDKLFDIVFAPTAGGSGSLFTQLLGIKARMAGGPVSSGTPYLVGERGPEIFTPNRSGMIVPNTSLGGGRGSGLVIEGGHTAINIEGSADSKTILAMQAMLAQRDKRFVANVAQANREMRRRSVA